MTFGVVGIINFITSSLCFIIEKYKGNKKMPNFFSYVWFKNKKYKGKLNIIKFIKNLYILKLFNFHIKILK